MSEATYTGHIGLDSGIQGHSAGPLFPAVIYVSEWEGEPAQRYWGVLHRGFDWGVFWSREKAEGFARLLLGHASGEDLARYLARYRAARAGIRPPDYKEPPERVSVYDLKYQRHVMPVDGVCEPIQIRQRYGKDADAWLAMWGYDPNYF